MKKILSLEYLTQGQGPLGAVTLLWNSNEKWANLGKETCPRRCSKNHNAEKWVIMDFKASLEE